MQVEFTKLEIDMIQHGLVPDSIYGCFEDENFGNCYTDWTEGQVKRACESLSARLKTGDFSKLTACEREVLEEAVHSSRWYQDQFNQDMPRDVMNEAWQVTLAAKDKARKILVSA